MKSYLYFAPIVFLLLSCEGRKAKIPLPSDEPFTIGNRDAYDYYKKYNSPIIITGRNHSVHWDLDQDGIDDILFNCQIELANVRTLKELRFSGSNGWQLAAKPFVDSIFICSSNPMISSIYNKGTGKVCDSNHLNFVRQDTLGFDPEVSFTEGQTINYTDFTDEAIIHLYHHYYSSQIVTYIMPQYDSLEDEHFIVFQDGSKNPPRYAWMRFKVNTEIGHFQIEVYELAVQAENSD